MSTLASYHSAAVAVNHNTSRYTELMLRSFFATHPAALPITFTVYDNSSQDDLAALAAYTTRKGIRFLPSGFMTDTRHNSHGELLRRSVLEQRNCTHYLFLDADICFLERDTIPTMVEELERAPDAFGIMPRLSSDGIREIPDEYRSIYTSRLHPCCALVKNTPVFQRVADRIGFSCARYLWAREEEYLDTFQLMTRVMWTHGLHYLLSSRLVLHFFSVSYDTNTEVVQGKAAHRDQRLAELRLRDPG